MNLQGEDCHSSARAVSTRSTESMDPQTSSVSILGDVSKDHRKTASGPASNKKVAEHISRWNAQQFNNEDYGPLQDVVATDQADEQEMTGNTQFDYTDETRKACLLCQRQFKSLDVLRRHTGESELHKKNLDDEATCRAGRQRKLADAVEQTRKLQMMKPAGFAPVSESTNADDTETKGLEYRDRAQERRIVFGTERNWKPGQEKRKVPPDAMNKKEVDVQPTVQSTFASSTGVGSSLLAKMGWTAGQGLGRQGDGRVDPVDARVLVPGAGLGSHALSSTPLTVEEYSARQTRFVLGSAADRRAERMYDRLHEGRR